MNKITILSIIFYGSFLVFPFIGGLIWLKQKKKILNAIFIPVLVLALLFTYSRFVERYLILVHNHELSISENFGEQPTTIKIALFSDAHIGLYKGKWFLEKVVSEVNAQNPDLVLIAGDFIYGSAEEDLFDNMQPLSEIKAPTFAVLGNHDQESNNQRTSGEFALETMYEALEPHITMIDNEIIQTEINGTQLTLVGIGSLWADNSKTDILNDINPNQTVIALMHNPDSVFDFPNYNIDLAVTGHTHGGQIRIPFIYKKVIPTKYGFDEGWYEIKSMPLFITAGIGEVGLPMRLFIPPRIDLIELTID